MENTSRYVQHVNTLYMDVLNIFKVFYTESFCLCIETVDSLVIAPINRILAKTDMDHQDYMRLVNGLGVASRVARSIVGNLMGDHFNWEEGIPWDSDLYDHAKTVYVAQWTYFMDTLGSSIKERGFLTDCTNWGGQMHNARATKAMSALNGVWRDGLLVNDVTGEPITPANTRVERLYPGLHVFNDYTRGVLKLSGAAFRAVFRASQTKRPAYKSIRLYAQSKTPKPVGVCPICMDNDWQVGWETCYMGHAICRPCSAQQDLQEEWANHFPPCSLCRRETTYYHNGWGRALRNSAGDRLKEGKSRDQFVSQVWSNAINSDGLEGLDPSVTEGVDVMLTDLGIKSDVEQFYQQTWNRKPNVSDNGAVLLCCEFDCECESGAESESDEDDRLIIEPRFVINWTDEEDAEEEGDEEEDEDD